MFWVSGLNKIMSEQKITGKTLVPIGLIAVLAAACIWIGSLANQVKALSDKNSPTRDEYNQMITAMNLMNNKLDTILIKISGSRADLPIKTP